MNYYEPTKNMTDAYYTDGTHKWIGKAAKGCNITQSGWQIFKMEYTGSNWILKYPIDPDTGKGSDAPKFVWNDVATYIYNILGC